MQNDAMPRRGNAVQPCYILTIPIYCTKDCAELLTVGKTQCPGQHVLHYLEVNVWE
jgi:hypothetical protein